MKKKEIRNLIKGKFGGRCSYCGLELTKGWHIDHLEPIRRQEKECIHPERETLSNLYPACASCNINKHNQTLEEFRAMIQKFVNSLNEYSVQYKIAKRYGLVVETSNKVVFYFETVLSANPK